jgi:NhaP-type Na+/H+ or K+/H+ antiporter
MAPGAAGPGIELGDAYALALLFGGIAVFAAVGALSHQHERAFSASIVYLGLGAGAAAVIALFDLPFLDPVADHEVVERLAELAMLTAIFATGLSLDRRLRWREWSSTVRLLAVAMPLTILGVAVLGQELLGLSLGAAVLLGAALAPTDPVLAGDVRVGPPGEEDEDEPVFSLSSEAALNDGLAAPIILAGILITDAEFGGRLLEYVLADIAWALPAGVAIGAVVGALAAASVKRLRDHDLLAPALDGYHAVATVLVTYGVAEALATNGFVAVFAAGLAFRRYERDHEVNQSVHHGAEQVEKIGELVLIALLGCLLWTGGLTELGWESWALVVTLLVAVRPLSCVVALAGSRMDHPREKAFVAWFGVRGVGTLYYAMVIVGADVLAPAERDLVLWTAIACVIVSIVVHGITAGPAMRRLPGAEARDPRTAPGPGEPADGARSPAEPAAAGPPR